MRWTSHLDGGPRRVNHAAVAINGRIYSFGGYSSEDKFAHDELIDVHILNTETFRWQKVLPIFLRKRKSDLNEQRQAFIDVSDAIASRGSTDSGFASQTQQQQPLSTDHQRPSTSFSAESNNLPSLFRQSSRMQARRSIPFAFSLAAPMVHDYMGRRRSVAEMHPLGQLRSYHPPVEEENMETNETDKNNTRNVSGCSQRSNDSGYMDEDAREHEFSLIHRFRRQRAATVGTSSAPESLSDLADGNNLRQHLNTLAENIRLVQEENVSSNEVPIPQVNQMEQDFNELGAMDTNDYYYGDAPPPGQIASDDNIAEEVENEDYNDEVFDERIDEDIAEESNSAYASEMEDDFEDFGDDDDNEEENQDGDSEDNSANRHDLGLDDNENGADERNNFIDGNEDDEVYDDFDFNYHNLANVGAVARREISLRRLQNQAQRRRLSHQERAPQRIFEQAHFQQQQRRRRANSLFVARGVVARRKFRRYVAPFQRYGHTVVAYNNKAYLWGGRNDEYGSSAILHEFDPLTCRWSVVRVARGSFEPPARDGHSAVVYGDSMYVFGGFEERYHRFSKETYVFHFPTAMWKMLRTEGKPPLHRDFHTACVLNDGKMFVFGGRSDATGHDNESDIYCEKLWCLDLNESRWMEVETTGDKPSGRRSHSVWTYNGRLYLFGGYSGVTDHHFNDMYVFDPVKSHWSAVHPTCGVPYPPSARRRQCTVAVKDKVFFFGGTMPSKVGKRLLDLADLYVLDYAPSLFTLSAEALIRYGLNERYDHILPTTLQRDVQHMYMPNSISQPNKFRQDLSNG